MAEQNSGGGGGKALRAVRDMCTAASSRKDLPKLLAEFDHMRLEDLPLGRGEAVTLESFDDGLFDMYARVAVQMAHDRSHAAAALVESLRRARLEVKAVAKSDFLLVSATDEALSTAAEQMQLKLRDRNGRAVEYTVKETESGNVPLREQLSEADELLLLEHCLEHLPMVVGLASGDSQDADKGAAQWSPAVLHGEVLDTLRAQGALLDIFPVHRPSERGRLADTVGRRSPLPTIGAIVRLQRYFGDAHALYFAFATLYADNLALLAVTGLILATLAGVMFPLRAWFLSLYSVAALLWSTHFLALWRRRSKELVYLFRNERRAPPVVAESSLYNDDDKPSDAAASRVSSASRLKQRKIIGWTALTTFILSACYLLFASLELVHIVDPWVDNHSHKYLYTKQVKAQQMALKQTPTVVYVLSLSLLELIYKPLARFVTKWERHPTADSYESTLFFRLAMFNFLNKNLSYLYLAFYRHLFFDLVQGLLLINMFENGLAIAKQLFVLGRGRSEERRKTQREAQLKKQDQTPAHSLAHTLEDEAKLPKVTSHFEDYLRISTQFAQLTLFGAAIPLGAAGASVGNYMQVCTELSVLLQRHQRPLAERQESIGSVMQALNVINGFAVATNVGVLILTSRYGDHLLGDSLDTPSEFFLIIVAEHGLLFLRHVLAARLLTTPRWVVTDAMRAVYRRYFAHTEQQRAKEPDVSAFQRVSELKYTGPAAG